MCSSVARSCEHDLGTACPMQSDLCSRAISDQGLTLREPEMMRAAEYLRYVPKYVVGIGLK